MTLLCKMVATTAIAPYNCMAFFSPSYCNTPYSGMPKRLGLKRMLRQALAYFSAHFKVGHVATLSLYRIGLLVVSNFYAPSIRVRSMGLRYISS